MEIFIDSGVLIQLFDNKEISQTSFTYLDVQRKFKELKSQCGDNIYTSNYILAESFNIILQFINDNKYEWEHLEEFWSEYIMKNISVVHIDEKYIKEAWDIVNHEPFKYLKYSFIDAITLAYVRSENKNYKRNLLVFTTEHCWNHFWWEEGYETKVLETVNIAE